jgi:hypothetical protein
MCRADDYSYIILYTKNGRYFSIGLSRMPAKKLNACGIIPATGKIMVIVTEHLPSKPKTLLEIL